MIMFLNFLHSVHKTVSSWVAVLPVCHVMGSILIIVLYLHPLLYFFVLLQVSMTDVTQSVNHQMIRS